MRLLWWSAMLRVLTLSTLFPNASQPTLGVFVERQTLALAGLDDVALEVVSPIGLPPWPLSLHSHYAPHALLPLREEWKGVTVHRPRFRSEEHTSELQSLMRISYAVFCLKKKEVITIHIV